MNESAGLFRPRTVAEAVALLAEQPDARPLGGGATLVAMMNARVIEPVALVSLAGIDELQGIRSYGAGGVRIGAFTRHRETANCPLLRGTAAVVRRAAMHIANATVRNMGTIGGAIAFADPGLDYPPALVAARAEVELAAPAGRRLIPAVSFFLDWYATALEPGEIVTAVILPAPAEGAGVYVKHARVSGDYATAAVATTLARTGQCRVVVGACGPAPITDEEIDDQLTNDRSDDALNAAAARLAGQAEPLDDVRGSADYRRALIPGLLRRAVRRAEAEVAQEAT